MDLRENFDIYLPRKFTEVFRIAALQAGAVARRFREEARHRTKPGQSSAAAAAVTTVDLAGQDLILHLLHRFFPEAAVDAEEETETRKLFPTESPDLSLIVVDPIDGTLNYTRSSPDYAVMGGLIVSGIYRAAVISFPAFRKTYTAVAGEGCWEETEGEPPRRIASRPLPERILISSRLGRDRIERLENIGFETEITHCSAVDAAAPAIGRATASVSPGRPGRRRAIGYLLTRESGGVIRIGETIWKGEDPINLPPDPGHTVVAATPEASEKILKALEG